MKKLKTIGLGGTFDRLHSGHEVLLDLAAFYANKVHIGLVGENFLLHSPKEAAELIQPLSLRKKKLSQYLSKTQVKIQISEITEKGMDRKLAANADLEGLIVSQETFLGGLEINKKREEGSNNKLVLILSPTVLDASGVTISSTLIRLKSTKLPKT